MFPLKKAQDVMGHNVLRSRSFQVLLTEMGLPIHAALLCAHTAKAVLSVSGTRCSSQPGPGEGPFIRRVQRHQRPPPGEQIRSARTSWQHKQRLG